VIQVRRVRTWLAVPLAAAAVCGAAVAAPGAAGAAVAAAGPASVPAGPGCPAGMLAWEPSATALASGDPQALAPGNLSAPAQAEFGAEALRLLSGDQVSWLGSTGCGQSQARSAGPAAGPPAGAAAPAARPALAAAPVPMTLEHWSGFQSRSSSFTGASMVWVVPTPLASAAPSTLSIWPGIGNGSDATTDLLIQAGTDQDQSGATTAWTEVVPGELEQPIAKMTVVPGDKMAVNVSWDQATGTAAFLVADITRHNAKMITQPVSGSPGGTAEWIVERSSLCATSDCNFLYLPHLLNFGSVQILNGFGIQTTGGTSTGNYIQALPRLILYTMKACLGSPTLATPGQLDAQGDFLDTFDHAGPVDPEFCEWTITPVDAAFKAILANVVAGAHLTDGAAGLALTCHQATLAGMTGINPSQQGSLATFVIISSAGLGSCTDANGNAWSLAQVAGSSWQLDGGTASADGVMTGELDNVAVNVSSDISGQTCKFRLAGRPSDGSTLVPDAIFTNPDQLNVTGASLAVSGVSGAGCGAAGVHDGDRFTLSAQYSTSNLTIESGPASG